MEGFDVQGNSFRDEKENGQCLIIAAGAPISMPLYPLPRRRVETPTIRIAGCTAQVHFCFK